MVHTVERGLTADERHALDARRDTAASQAGTALFKSGAISLLVCGVLGVLTRLASDAPTWVIAAFWIAAALGFGLWVGWPMRRQHAMQAAAYTAALAANRARETRVTTRRVVEFEEAEDEGACFAFDAGEGRSFFIVGQEFYADDQFPNSDFSYVEVLDERGHPIDVLLTMHGERVAPERRVPAARKLDMEPPEHLAIVPVPIDQVGAA